MCEKHGIQLQETCGTKTCGMCYMDWLDSEPVKLPKLQPIDLTYGLGGHDPHYRPPVMNDSPIV